MRSSRSRGLRSGTGSRGFHSFDVLVATLLLSAIVVAGVVAANGVTAWRDSLAFSEKQGRALLLADQAIKKCVSEGGLAKCENGLLYSHVMESGVGLLDLGEEKTAGFCVNRLVLFEGKEKILRVCLK